MLDAKSGGQLGGDSMTLKEEEKTAKAKRQSIFHSSLLRFNDSWREEKIAKATEGMREVSEQRRFNGSRKEEKTATCRTSSGGFKHRSSFR